MNELTNTKTKVLLLLLLVAAGMGRAQELHGNTGQKVLDLRHLADGVYIYTVRCGEYLITDKLIITK